MILLDTSPFAHPIYLAIYKQRNPIESCSLQHKGMMTVNKAN